MKQIPLTKGQFALVDDEDYEHLIQFKWQANFRKDRNIFYAVRLINRKPKMKAVYMHRLILGIVDTKIQVDHKDHNTLNNCKSNLRIATASQNSANRKVKHNSSSKYLGLSWKKSHKAWEVNIRKDKKTEFLGNFKNENDAALAYNNAAIRLHGEFANLNVI